jgi:hypothetical protein
MCGNRAHDRENLGIGGRRVQVSRSWSGKTLSDHKADRAAVVREVLAAAGVEALASDRLGADVRAADGVPRYVWEPVPTSEASYATTVLVSIRQAQRWRADYEAAKDVARASPTGEPADLWTTVRQPQPRGRTIASQPRSSGWSSGVSGANHAVTRSALDGQPGGHTIKRRAAAGTNLQSRE